MSDSPDSPMPNSTPWSAKRNALWHELSRRDPTNPYAWAMAHRRLRGQPLLHLPYMEALIRDPHPEVVILKSAQAGISELLLSYACWAADTQLGGRGHVLYVMPTQNMIDDFTQGRLDRALADSPYLAGRMRPTKGSGKGPDNKRIKRIGDGLIYLRGCENSKQIASIDADLVLLDEYDAMDAAVRTLAAKRIGSSAAGRLWMASTPSTPEAGIHERWLASDCRLYYLPCPACGESQPLRWPHNVDQDRRCIVCRVCRAPLDVQAEGAWVAQQPGNVAVHGYHLNKLYSPWLDVAALIAASEETTLAGQEEFMHSDLGVAWTPRGGGLSPHDLDQCVADYLCPESTPGPCDMGIDVGAALHVVIREHPSDNPRYGVQHPPRLIFLGEVGWDDLDALWDRYGVRGAVIDGLPETSKAAEFAQRHPGKARLAYYQTAHGHRIRRGDRGAPDRDLINRTEALDAVSDRFQSRAVALPRNARELGGRVKDGQGEYYRELRALQRSLDRDHYGNWKATWDAHGKADHFLHAEVYCWRAAQPTRRGRMHKPRPVGGAGGAGR